MLKVLVIGAVGVPAALLAVVASLGVMVVDVREGGPDGHRIVVPIPLLAAQTALALVPEGKARLEANEATKYLPMAREVLEALEAGPDGEIVRVEEPDEQVLVVKEGRMLRVRVHGRAGEDVSVNVPIRVALSALPDANGRVSTAALAASLSSARFTDIVEVQDGNDHVKVRIY
jgi:hypothetical protein